MLLKSFTSVVVVDSNLSVQCDLNQQMSAWTDELWSRRMKPEIFHLAQSSEADRLLGRSIVTVTVTYRERAY